MKEIKLIGDIADEYGSSFSLDVRTPMEAIRALNANLPGFSKFADDGRYVFIITSKSEDEGASRQITSKSSSDLWSDDDVMIVMPEVAGKFSLAAIIATAAVAAAGVAAGSAAALIITAIVYIAVYVAIAAIVMVITQALMGEPDTSIDSPEETPSYLFNGVVNTTKQGHRLPILYGGPLLTGSMILSGRIITEDVPV